MDYLTIATLLLYVGVARLIEVINLRVWLAALLVVILPEVLRLTIFYILISDVSPLTQMGIGGMVKLGLQFVTMLITFIVLKQKEEEIVGWWICLAIGTTLSVFAIPPLVANILSFI